MRYSISSEITRKDRAVLHALRLRLRLRLGLGLGLGLDLDLDLDIDLDFKVLLPENKLVSPNDI